MTLDCGGLVSTVPLLGPGGEGGALTMAAGDAGGNRVEGTDGSDNAGVVGAAARAICWADPGQRPTPAPDLRTHPNAMWYHGALGCVRNFCVDPATPVTVFLLWGRSPLFKG